MRTLCRITPSSGHTLIVHATLCVPLFVFISRDYPCTLSRPETLLIHRFLFVFQPIFVLHSTFDCLKYHHSCDNNGFSRILQSIFQRVSSNVIQFPLFSPSSDYCSLLISSMVTFGIVLISSCWKCIVTALNCCSVNTHATNSYYVMQHELVHHSIRCDMAVKQAFPLFRASGFKDFGWCHVSRYVRACDPYEKNDG